MYNALYLFVLNISLKFINNVTQNIKRIILLRITYYKQNQLNQMIQIRKLMLGHHYTTNWDMSLSSSNFCQKKDSMHFAHSFIMNGKNSHGRIGRKQSKRSGKTSCMRRRVREKIRIHLHFTAFFLPNYDHSKLYGALFVSLHKITPHSCRFPKESHCM